MTRIGDGFFYLCYNLNSVTLPTTLTSIGDYAFACCSSLGGMMLPDGLTTIGNYAFSGCARLYGFLLPAGVRSIGDYAFQNCVGLGGLNFEGHDTSFGDCVFAGCTYGFVFSCFRDSDARAYADEHSYPVDLPDCGNDTKLDFDRAGKATILGTGAMYDGFSFPFTDKLRSVEIEEGVTSLSYRLFKDCVNLRSVSLPSTLSKIGASAFSGCTTLDSVTILHRRASIGTDAFASCPALTIIGWEGSTAQDYATAHDIPFEALTALTPCGDSVGWRLNVRTGTVTISGTGEMWDYPRGGQNSPFANDSSVLRVVVEGGVTSVGAHFFENCANLAELSLAGSVESIGDNAFSHTALSSLILPEGLRSIGFAAFYECHSLLSLRLPESLLTIGANAFFYDNALSSVVLPRNVTGVGSSAFSRCQALSRAMLLNADTALGDNAFYDCAASLVLCGYTGSTAQEYAEEEEIAFFALDAGPSFFLPEGLTALGEDAFRDIAALAVVIPESVTSISGNPFRGSRVTLIYGYPASAAETLAETCSFGFIPISDDWMENHRG